MPPTALRRNQRIAVVHLDRRAGQQPGIGGAEPVDPGAGQRRRAEPGAHRPVGRRARRQRLGVGEVGRRLDRGASPIRSIDRSSSSAISVVGQPVEQRVGVGVRPDLPAARSTPCRPARPTTAPRRRRGTAAPDRRSRWPRRAWPARWWRSSTGVASSARSAVPSSKVTTTGSGCRAGARRSRPDSTSTARSRVMTRPEAASSAICSSNSARWAGRPTARCGGRPGGRSARPPPGRRADDVDRLGGRASPPGDATRSGRGGLGGSGDIVSDRTGQRRRSIGRRPPSRSTDGQQRAPGVGHHVEREPLEGARPAGRAQPRPDRGGPARRRGPARNGRGVVDEHAGLAVDDHLGDAADAVTPRPAGRPAPPRWPPPGCPRCGSAAAAGRPPPAPRPDRRRTRAGAPARGPSGGPARRSAAASAPVAGHQQLGLGQRGHGLDRGHRVLLRAERARAARSVGRSGSRSGPGPAGPASARAAARSIGAVGRTRRPGTPVGITWMRSRSTP